MRIERWVYTIPLWLRSLFQRRRVDAELDEELRDHLQRQTEENLARGMRPEEARRAALIAMGGLEQRRQQCREERGVHWIDDLGRDLVYGARMMLREPGFAVTAVLILALGIGATTAIFSCDRALFFRALPYRIPDRLVELFQKSTVDASVDTMPIAPANYFDWEKDGQPFEAFAAWRDGSLNLSGGNNPERVRSAQVSANLFAVLGVEPMLGRAFRAGEDAPGKGQLAVLSYGLWQRRFAGNPDVLGKTIRASDQVYTVIGVMPAGFRFPIGWMPSDVDVWTPLTFAAGDRLNRTDITLNAIARLRRGVTIRQAQASLAAISEDLARAYPKTNRGWGVNVLPLAARGTVGMSGLFALLSLAVGLVLLIACANVANLLLARGMERQKELGVRVALGARRARLVRQLIAEGILLAVAGGLPGVGLGYFGIRALASLAPATELPELRHAGLDMPTAAVALGLSILTGVLFSLLPALALSRVSPQATRGERSGTANQRGQRLKLALVIGEVALTLALLLCAGDILNSFTAYMSLDPGFNARHVLTMRLSLPKQKYGDPREWAAFFQRAVDEVGGIPGVQGAAAGSGAPMEQSGLVFRFHLAGQQAPAAMDFNGMAEYLRITPDYFRVAGMRLVRGRSLLAGDGASSPAEAVVNETLARKQFGSQDPIGKRVFLDGDVNASAAAETRGRPLEIVGVVRDTKEYGLFQMTPQMIYVPLAQDPQPAMSLLVKTAAEPGAVLPAIRARLAKLDPDEPVYDVRSLEDIFRETHAFFRFNTLLLAAFAGMALLLSLIGIYGVVAYAVSQRRREFGIRLALGSPRRAILLLVLRQGAWMSAIGIVLGLMLGWPAVRLLTRTLQESLFLKLLRTGVALYPALCVGIALTLMLACLIPARSATNADPMEALRCD